MLNWIRPSLPSGDPIHLVGGAVRDHLLGRPAKDLDFVLKSGAIRAARSVSARLGGDFYILDEARDTARILTTGPGGERIIVDFSAYRGESLEEDQRARDFTVNSIGIDAHQPSVVS